MTRCQDGVEEDSATDAGMGANYQGIESGGDEEMVVFFGAADPRAIEDRKRLKFSKKQVLGLLEEDVAIRS
jgi:hypothetical protein